MKERTTYIVSYLPANDFMFPAVSITLTELIRRESLSATYKWPDGANAIANTVPNTFSDVWFLFSLLEQCNGVPATTLIFMSDVSFRTNLSSMKCRDPSSGLKVSPVGHCN